MPLRLNLQYRSAGDFVHHMEQQASAGAVLLPLVEAESGIQQFQQLELRISFTSDDPGGTLQAEVLQLVPQLGIAVCLEHQADAAVLAGGAEAAEDARPPEVTVEQSGESPRDDQPPQKEQKPWVSRRKSGPLSLSFDMLQAEWNGLTVPEKARVAKWGDRSARGLVLRKQDRMLHAVLLTNPKLAAGEVAILAGRANLDPELLRRISMSREWTRHMAVKRALICNSKLPIPQVTKLLRAVDLAELRRLSTSGRVRTSVKQAIDKQIARITGKGR